MSAALVDTETGEVIETAPTAKAIVPPRDRATDHLPIGDIVVENRHRRDLGDLSDLRGSIEVIGLMHPVTVDPENRLVAGERRLAVCRELGWPRVPVRVLDVTDLDRARRVLIAERDENTCRKEMTLSEKVALADALAALERPKAAARTAANLPNGSEDPFGPDNTAADPEHGRTNAIAAEAVGISRATYQRAKSVVDATEDPDPKIAAVARDALDEMDASGSAAPAAAKVKRARERGASKVPVSQQLDRIEEMAATGHHSTQIAKELGTTGENIRMLAKKAGIKIPADDILRGKHNLNATRIVRETVQALDGLAMGVGLIEDYSTVDLTTPEAQEWAASLTDSLSVLNRFAKQIKKETTHVLDQD